MYAKNSWLRWKRAAKILMVAAVAAPAFAQPTLEPVARDQQEQQIVDRIGEEEAQNGTLSTGLIEPFMALILLYQEYGDHDLAIAAIERTRQIVRANYGLYSIEEVPLLRQLVYSEEARGNAEAAWELEQELLDLVELYPADLRTLPILREIGDKRMDVLGRYHAGEFPPQIVLGCYYSKNRAAPRPSVPMGPAVRRCQSGSRRNVVHAILSEAQLYYMKAIDVLLANGRYPSDEVRDLETQLLRGNHRYGGFLLVDRVLARALSHAPVGSASALSRIDTLIRIADWNVLHAHRSDRFNDYEELVIETYRQAYNELEREDVEQASIDEIFSPSMPVVLPSFFDNPLVSEEASESAGYIDVAFDVTKYGTSDNIVILDDSTATRAAERELVRLIKHGIFRPRMTNGRFAESAPVVVRYYLSDES